jgi:hypothetical protein
MTLSLTIKTAIVRIAIKSVTFDIMTLSKTIETASISRMTSRLFTLLHQLFSSS